MKQMMILFCAACLALLAGCGKPAEESKPAPQITNAPVAAPVAVKVEEKQCFACKGEGTIKCPVCVDGQVECPGT